MKKILAMIMAIAIVLGLCACGGGEGGTNADGKVQISIGMGTKANVTDYKDNALTKWLEETTGYEIEIVEYTGGTDIPTQISTTIAAGQELPDILWNVNFDSRKTIETYGHDGYFVDLKSYYDDKEGASKNFWTRMAECLTEQEQEHVLHQITDRDTGGMYGIPSVETSLVDGLDYMAWINTEWLDKLQLQVPTNTEELYNVLVAFRDKDPNGNGEKDEIPMMGTQKSSGAGQALNFLINLFIYYNDDHVWQDYDGDGKLESVFTQDKFREALSFINKLYEEKLLHNMIYTATTSDMKKIVTPQNGTAMCGIFFAHLTAHATKGSPVIYQYDNLKSWGAATSNDVYVDYDCFITETAEKKDIVDECFKLMMLLWSEDGAMRLRYGQYGVDWTDADPGSKSAFGLDATYKMINDPYSSQGAQMWGYIAGTMNHYAEGETAQLDNSTGEWELNKARLHALARKNFEDCVKENNPKFLANPFLEGFLMTSAESEASNMARTNLKSVTTSYKMNFITGANNMDIDNDKDWQKFQDEMKNNGYDDVKTLYQTCYERQKAN